MTTQARELAKLVSNAGDLTFGDDIHLLSDAGVLNFGADNDVTLTHVADTGLLLNSSRQLQFGDSGTFIRQEADGVLDITSDTEVEINATTVDINANVDISGNLVLGGNITIGDADSDDISFGGELTSHIIPNADDTYDLGSSTKQWRNAYVDGTLYVDAIDLDGTALTAFNTDAAQVFNESGNDADFRVESNGNANRFFIDGGANSGEGAVIVGHNASLGQHRAFQISGNSPDTSGMEMFKYTNDTSGPTISMSKSRGGSIGTAATVNDNDIIGTINWFADDGTDTGNYVATIHAEIDGTPGSNDTPGALVFNTTADGANTGTERMRIGATGRASWAAGGVGTVGTQARDFTFYTEGATNGVAVHSNDERLIFMGAAASSGSGVDTGYFQIENGGAAKIALNSNGDSYFDGGNLGLGTTSPAFLGLTGTGKVLHLGGTDTQLRLANSILHHDNSGLTKLTLRNNYGATSNSAQLELQAGFITLETGTSFTERLRINSSGRQTFNSSGTANAHATYVGEVGVSSKALAFEHTVGGGEVGTIVTASSSTAYNTSSDYRLKENVDYTWDATTRLNQLKPARFNWIADDTNTLVDGFLAHEVSSIVPNAVFGEKDGMADPILYEDGDEIPSGKSVGDVKTASVPEYQAIDHSKLVPLLVKTIQELEARIATLEG